jgi:hypothetical protein
VLYDLTTPRATSASLMGSPWLWFVTCNSNCKILYTAGMYVLIRSALTLQLVCCVCAGCEAWQGACDQVLNGEHGTAKLWRGMPR